MRVGILGNHWGRVHCGTFRRAFCQIHAIVGLDPAMSARIAFEEHVPHFTPDSLRDADIIVVATPAPTHRRLVEAFADKPILCEKPLLGVLPDEPFLALAREARLFVNYAFSFLPSARAFREVLSSGGVSDLQLIDLEVEVALPSIKTASEALVEVAAHPLAFLLVLLGPLQATQADIDGRFIRILFASSTSPVSLAVRLGDAEGFRFDLSAVGKRGRLFLSGGYRPDTRWRFEPLLLDGHPVLGPVLSERHDIWYEANCALVSTFVSVVRDGATAPLAQELGLLDGSHALGIERALSPVLPASS